MFWLIKKTFISAMTFFSFNVLNVNSLECVSMNNQECKIRAEIINVNTNEAMIYPYSVKINKCKGSCNTINDPYAKICVPDTFKNMTVKAFNLMSRTNSCKCRKRIINKLVEEYSEDIDGNEMLYNETLDVIPLSAYKKVYTSCMVYIVLFVIFLITSICICWVFIYFCWYLKKYNIITNFKNFNYELNLCYGCHDLMQKAMNFNDVAIASIKGNDYRIHFWYMSKNEAISIMHNSGLNEKTELL